MADQKLPHFIPRIQTGNRSPRCNNLQGWFCPFKCSLIPSACGTPRDAGVAAAVRMQDTSRTSRASGMMKHGQPCSWQSFSSSPVKWQEGNKALPAPLGAAPPAFPSFPSMKEQEIMVIILFKFPLRWKSGLKSCKKKVFTVRGRVCKVISLQRGLNLISFIIQRTKKPMWKWYWGLQMAVFLS